MLGKFVLLSLFLRFVSSVKDGLSVLVNLQFVDDDFGWVDSDGDGHTISLVTSKFLNVNHVFPSVNLNNFSVFAFVSSSGDNNLVVLSNGHGSNVVLLAELTGQRSTHDHSSD